MQLMQVNILLQMAEAGDAGELLARQSRGCR